MSKKKEEVKCYGCGKSVPINHTHISCPQNHDLCRECTDTFVNVTVMPELCEKNFPPKCLICKQPFNRSVFERNIKDARHIRIFQSLNIFTSYELGEGEIWVNCPTCGYREIRKTNEKELPVLAFCKNRTCKKITCYYCKGEVKKETVEEFQGEFDLDEEEEEEGEHIKSIRKHLTLCSRFGPLKLRCEDIISEASQRKCPSCSLLGHKDENCTHITCGGCRSVWCYVCGKMCKDLDKEDGAAEDDIYAHNVDWDENEKRCPSSFVEIHDLDDEWPDNDDGAKALFHRKLILNSLRKFLDEYGEEELRKMVGVYPAVLGGFSVEEMLEVDDEKPLYMSEEQKEEYEESKKRKRNHEDFDDEEENRPLKKQKID